VRKWRSRFLAARLEGLSDEPRPGAPRKITDEQIELVITKTLEERGAGQDTHRSTRSLATATGMSQSAISRIWRAFGLKPHLTETWKLSGLAWTQGPVTADPPRPVSAAMDGLPVPCGYG
jgi:transposase